jgi:hypothetical protein
VNEELWLHGTPHKMLSALRRLQVRSQRPVDERKFRFFALSCCRLAWPALVDERSRRAVDVAERALTGMASPDEFDVATVGAVAARDAAAASYALGRSADTHGAMIATSVVASVIESGYDQSHMARVRDALAFRGIKRPGSVLIGQYAQRLHEIFGNPFRPVSPAREWRTDTVVSLAQQMYAAHEFSAMAILADALQDAGCNNEDVLNHCRDTSATHVRGCWVVDLLLGKGPTSGGEVVKG